MQCMVQNTSCTLSYSLYYAVESETEKETHSAIIIPLWHFWLPQPVLAISGNILLFWLISVNLCLFFCKLLVRITQ